MNKIYSKVWNDSLKQLVVASELTAHRRGSGQGKGASARRSQRKLCAGILVVLMAAGGSGWVQAQTAYCSTSPFYVINANATCMGNTAYSNGNSTAIGAFSKASTALGSPVALGYFATADVTSGNGSPIALGTNSVARGVGGTVALPNGVTSFEAIAIGNAAYATAQGATSIGTLADATGVWSTSLGSFATASGTWSTAIGTSTTAGNYATALGYGALASGNYSTALGINTDATALAAIALGTSSQALAASSVAFGDTSSVAAAAGQGSIAGGYHSTVQAGTGAVAMGASNAVNGNGAVAIGNANKATGDGSVALGDASYATGAGSVALGDTATASQTNATAVGAFASATGTLSTALGVDAEAGNDATAVGSGASATGSFSSALGINSEATALGATALGTTTHALAQSSLALGDGSTVAAAAGTGSIAGGHNSNVLAGTGAVALGESQSASGNGAVAIGDPNTATGNGAVAVGATNIANGNGAVALGNGNNATGDGSVALGNASSATAAGALALGANASAVAQAGDVALGTGSVTSTVVATSGATIGGTAYTFAGNNPLSTVSVGSASSPRTITNVAAGRISATSTDAVNGSELFATNQAVNTLSTALGTLGTSVTNSLTHYYSINDGGVQQGNYANDGATGSGSLALGAGALATQTNASAMGLNAQAIVADGVALGSQSVSDRAVAPATGVVGGTLTPYNTTDRTLLGAVSVGSATTYRQIINVADGTAPNDAVTVRQLTGSLTSFATTATMYFHANSTLDDSLAVGTNAIAVGPQAVANGDNSLAMGLGAVAEQNAPGGVAIGENATSSLQDSIAVGTSSSAGGIQSVSIGAGSVTGNPTNVALGAGSNASAQAGDVALGANSVTAAVRATASMDVGDNTFDVAGTTPTSTVSVGRPGSERTITNVAAGEVSATSTDAVNGSELYAINQQVNTNTFDISNLITAISKINGGGSGSSGAGAGAGGSGTDGGLGGGSATGSGAIAVGGSSSATGSGSIAIGTGSSASGTNSVALGAGSSDGGESNVVSVGSPTNLRRITNVAPGIGPNDAVNVSQLNQGIQAAQNWAQNYTDQKFNSLNQNLNTISRRANAGVASAMAMAGLPQAYQPNQSGAAIAFGGFHGEAGFAFGLSTVSETGRWVYKVSISSDTRGDAGISAGAGMFW